MQSKTQQVGQRTVQGGRHSNLAIANKNKDFEYSFRTRKAIEDGGGRDMYGYEPLGIGNSDSETWDLPKTLRTKTQGVKQMIYQDVIACRRPIEVAEHFRMLEDEKYNANKRLVLNNTGRSRHALRELRGSGAHPRIRTTSDVSRAFTQRTGPSEGSAVEPPIQNYVDPHPDAIDETPEEHERDRE